MGLPRHVLIHPCRMYSQYVLDMAIVANQAYVMFSDAHIEVLTIGGSN
jgi:hypothetical protein